MNVIETAIEEVVITKVSILQNIKLIVWSKSLIPLKKVSFRKVTGL